MLQKLLEDETYLEENGSTIRGHIERIISNEFELKLKRTFDCYKARGVKRFDIPGLRNNLEKNFKQGSIVVSV